MHLVPILAHRHVTHILLAVLYRPVAAPQPFQIDCPRFLCTQAGGCITHFHCSLATLALQPLTRAAHDLSCIWPVPIFTACAQALQRARFEPARPFAESAAAIILLSVSLYARLVK